MLVFVIVCFLGKMCKYSSQGFMVDSVVIVFIGVGIINCWEFIYCF